MKILQLTSHFSPNIGGVETHLDDLVGALAQKKHEVFVLTYRPLQTRTLWKTFEKNGKVQILRIPWLPGLFYKLVSHPVLEFLYLFPGLFLVTPFVLLFKRLDVVHAHGLVAGFIGVFWGKIFRMRVVVSTHNIYSFPKRGFYREFARWIFENADYAMGLSRQSAKEIISLGVNKKKVGTFTYWIDLARFKPRGAKERTKSEVGWANKFIVLYVGRLVREKGIPEILEAIEEWNEQIFLAVAGEGPMEDKVKRKVSTVGNLLFVGKLSQEKLPMYYSAADLLIVPSTHEEGFGRVILESLACGTPVIGSRRGAIPEAMDETVGKLVDVNSKNIKKAVEYFYKSPEKLKKLSGKAREFAKKRYSERNVETIINAYRGKKT